MSKPNPPPAVGSVYDPSGPIPFLRTFNLEISPAEPDGRDAEKITGTADDCAAAAAAYLRTCPDGACLQWPVGAGWSELFLHPSLSLAQNLEQARDELEGIGCAPAILSDAESALARAIVPALLAAALELEKAK